MGRGGPIYWEKGEENNGSFMGETDVDDKTCI
ncbi:hypothetical protein I656_03948 [Geobacillus sp. WSUCF1]|nr:hypothetical protein I656_03948 [Geobacillus sp. WSUCF1]GAJ59071.1 hypothetical protein B23_2295 [Geobacillus thermoleovorans B23]